MNSLYSIDGAPEGITQTDVCPAQLPPPFDPHHRLATLIRRIAEHDEPAFDELYRLTRHYLHHVVMRILHLPHLADETLQDAYLNIWLNAASFRPGQGSPMTWLIAVVRNRALSVLRSDREHFVQFDDGDKRAALAGSSTDSGLAEPDDCAGVSSPATLCGHEAPADEVHLYMRLDGALTCLEPAQRQTIALAYGRDLSHAELAQHMGVPLGTAKSWLRRGLQRMRHYLEQPRGACHRWPARPGMRLSGSF